MGEEEFFVLSKFVEQETKSYYAERQLPCANKLSLLFWNAQNIPLPDHATRIRKITIRRVNRSKKSVLLASINLIWAGNYNASLKLRKT